MALLVRRKWHSNSVVCNYLLRGIKLPYLDEIDIFSKINNYFIDYFEKGRNIRPLFKNLKSYRKKYIKITILMKCFMLIYWWL